MKHIKVNKQKVSIPTSWNDVTFQQALDLQQCRTELDIVALFLKVPVEKLSKYKDIKGIEIVKGSLNFLETPPKASNLKLIDGYLINKQLEDFEIGQYEDMKVLYGQDAENWERKRDLCACIMQPFVDGGDYSYIRSVELRDWVMSLPYPNILELEAFFLKGLKKLKNGTSPTSKVWDTIRMKSLQAILTLRGSVY